MDLAKPCLDVGLLTGDPATIAFLRDAVGLDEPTELAIGPGVTQHRFAAAGSVVKANLVAGLGPGGPRAIRQVTLHRADQAGPVVLEGPDGLLVGLAPAPGGPLVVHLDVPDLGRARSFYVDGLGWTEVDGAPGHVRVGTSTLVLTERAEAPTAPATGAGWTYLTVQVHDLRRELAELGRRGIEAPAGTQVLRDVARFAMIADPWGGAIEVSQRADLSRLGVAEG